MKIFLALSLALCLISCIAACGGKDTASNTSSKTSQTQSTIPDTSSEAQSTDNGTSNTESEPEDTSSTPADNITSSTTSTPDGEHTHSYGNWKPETVALVNRTGTDKRTCSTCSAAETRENTENVLENSFYDPGLGQLFYWGFNYDGSLRVYSLLEYAPYRYDKFAYKENSTDTIYDTLAKSFVLDDSFKDKIRAEGKANPYYYGYNEANDTFTFEGNNMGSMGNAEPVGYIHNGGNQYTVYYSFAENGSDTEQIYKVVLEFKRTDRFDMMDWELNGEENKYLSFEKVSSVPSDLTK